MNKVNRPAARKFEYKPPSLSTMKERAESSGKKFDSIFKNGFDIFRPKAGNHNVRFLPATWDDPKHYAYEVHLHQFVGPSHSTYLCPNKMKSERCPMCEMADRMQASEPDNAKQLQARNSFVPWILDRNDTEPKTLYRPKLWQMSWSMNQDFSVLAYNSKNPEKTLYIDNPDNGYDVAFKREGKGKNDTKYIGKQIERESSPIADKDEDYWAILDFIQDHPIPSILQFYEYDHLKKVITGQVVEADEDETDDEGDTREAEAGAAEQRRRARPGEEATDDAEETTGDDAPAGRSAGGQPRQRSTRDADPPQDGPRDRARPRGRQEEDTVEDESEGETRRPARTR